MGRYMCKKEYQLFVTNALICNAFPQNKIKLTMGISIYRLFPARNNKNP